MASQSSGGPDPPPPPDRPAGPPPAAPPAARISPVPPSGAAAGVAAGIANRADDVIGRHLDGGAEPASQRKRKQQNNAQKIESVFHSVDILREAASLQGDALQCLRDWEPKAGKKIPAPIFAALELSLQLNQKHTSTIAETVNNTAGKKMAEQAHKKLTKPLRDEAKDRAAQRRALTTDNPIKALKLGVRDLKEFVKQSESIAGIGAGCGGASAKSAAPEQAESLLPRKKTKAAAEPAEEVEVEEIRLPRPANGRLMYTPQEAANIMYEALVKQSPGRSYIKRFKEEMIRQRKVPVQKSRLNEILQQHGGPGKPYAPPFWDMRGRKSIVKLEVLEAKVKAHFAAFHGQGWSKRHTKEALLAEKKAEMERKELDTSNVEEPSRTTVDSYHASLQSLPCFTQRAVASKTVHREVAATSQRAMLANTAGVISSRCMVVPNPESLPLHMRFDESRATPGAILAREMFAKAAGVPPQSVQFTSRNLLFNQDDSAASYSNFRGDGSCEGDAAQNETMLVDREAAAHGSYGVHGGADNSQKFNGIKNLIGAGGHLAPPFIQVLNFDETEMPPEKVPNGIILLKIRGLTPDGGINPHSEAYGYLALIRKGVGIETEMFRLHDAIVYTPFVDKLRADLGEDDPDQVPDYLRSIRTCDGGVPQLKAIQDPATLDRLVKRKESQAKFSKNTSDTIQALDVGKGHKRARHHLKTLTDDSLPISGIVLPLTVAIQSVRDQGKLVITAAKMDHIVNAVIRMPTVVRKSYTEGSIIESFTIAGLLDKSLQGCDVNKLFQTYKATPTTVMRQNWLRHLPTLIKFMLEQGRILESQFQMLGFPVDVDTNGVEHPLSEAFATQSHRQRFVDLTHPSFREDWHAAMQGSALETAAVSAASQQEAERMARVEEERQRQLVLKKNSAYEIALHNALGRSGDACTAAAFQNDDPTSDTVLKAIAKLRGKCKEFVLARRTTCMKDKHFKEPSNVGKLDDLNAALAKIATGSSEEQLTKQQNSWIFQAVRAYKLPVVLQSTGLDLDAPDAGAAEDEEASAAPADPAGGDSNAPAVVVSRTVIVDTAQSMRIAESPFLLDAELARVVGDCFAGSRISTAIHSGMHEQVDALVKLLPTRLTRLLNLYPMQVQASFVFSALRDNLHRLAQVVVLAGQANKNVEAAKVTDSLLRPTSVGFYPQPLLSETEKGYQGVAIYHDAQRGNFRAVVPIFGKDNSFHQRYEADRKDAASAAPKSNLTRAYPAKKPAAAQLGGWDGTFGNLTMHAGISFDPNGDVEQLTKIDGGLLLWSERTMAKLQASNVTGCTTLQSKQLNFVCYMFELVYFLMMGKGDAIVDRAPFSQFLGPIKANEAAGS